MAKFEDQMVNLGPEAFYTPEFRQVIEDHLYGIRADESTRVEFLTGNQPYVYEHDFYGLLLQYNVPYHLHWVTMRLNELKNPYQNLDDLKVILIPNEQKLLQILSQWRTVTTSL